MHASAVSKDTSRSESPLATGPAAGCEDPQSLVGNACVAAGLGDLPLPEYGPDCALSPELAFTIRVQLASARDAIDGVRSVARFLPEQYVPRAGWALEDASILCEMLAEDRDTLAGLPRDEGGALLAEVHEELAELASEVLVLDAFRFLGEATSDLRSTLTAKPLLALFGVPCMLEPTLSPLLGLVHEVEDTRRAVLSSARDCGEVVLQVLLQKGLGALFDEAKFAAGPLGPLVARVGALASNRVDDALGTDPAVLASRLLDASDQLKHGVRAARTLDEVLHAVEVLCGVDVERYIAETIAGIDTVEFGQAAVAVISGLEHLRELAPQVRTAQETFAQARGMLGPALEVLGAEIDQQVAYKAEDVAAASQLVNDSLAEAPR